MAVYGKTPDWELNKEKGVQLYVPGQTQFKQGDVFLGGTGTGVTDEMIGPAQRIYGQTAEDTSNVFGKYQSNLSQLQAQQPQSQSRYQLPPGARPTLAFRDAMAREGQYNQEFAAQQRQKALDYALEQTKLDTQDTQWDKSYGLQERDYGLKEKDYELRKQNALEDNDYRMAALNASYAKGSSGGGSSAPKALTQTQVSNNITGQTLDYLNKWASGQALDDNGNVLPRATADEIQQWVKDKSGQLMAGGADVSYITKWAGENFKWNPEPTSEWNTQAQTWGPSPASQSESKWYEFWK